MELLAAKVGRLRREVVARRVALRGDALAGVSASAAQFQNHDSRGGAG